jgi:hypothetical protein
MTDELFAQWRSEIAADLDASRQELAEVEIALATAETAHRAVRAHARSMQVALAKLNPEPSPWPSRSAPIATALWVRVADYQQAERSAVCAVASANGQIAALSEKIADYDLALRQIDAITAPAQPVDEDDTSDAVVAAAA